MDARDQATGVQIETQWRLKGSVPRMVGFLELTRDGPDTDTEPRTLREFHMDKASNTARGYPSRTPRNQSDAYKAANTARGHSSRTP